jgi:hypothetical protein
VKSPSDPFCKVSNILDNSIRFCHNSDMGISLAEITTRELIALQGSLENLSDSELDSGPTNQFLADIESILVDRDEIDRLVQGW